MTSWTTGLVSSERFGDPVECDHAHSVQRRKKASTSSTDLRTRSAATPCDSASRMLAVGAVRQEATRRAR